MKAAIVRERGKLPTYGDFPDPEPGEGQTVVAVTASALSPLVRGRASGAHYSATAALPNVVGVDGVGRLPDGTRVFFFSPVAPFGGMAERTLVPAGHATAVPDGVSDVQAAALGNPGMSSWAALTVRARFARGERVLINGATGIAGRLAVQVARHLGASHIVATGRDPETLAALPADGADVVISLAQTTQELDDVFRAEFRAGVDVVLDYLWGESAEALITAIVREAKPDVRLRFVQLGSTSAAAITLAGASLRSSGLELMGSGIGSLSDRTLLEAMRGVLGAAAAGAIRVDAVPVPLTDVEAGWTRDYGKRRVVFTLGA